MWVSFCCLLTRVPNLPLILFSGTFSDKTDRLFVIFCLLIVRFCDCNLQLPSLLLRHLLQSVAIIHPWSIIMTNESKNNLKTPTNDSVAFHWRDKLELQCSTRQFPTQHCLLHHLNTFVTVHFCPFFVVKSTCATF